MSSTKHSNHDLLPCFTMTNRHGSITDWLHCQPSVLNLVFKNPLSLQGAVFRTTLKSSKQQERQKKTRGTCSCVYGKSKVAQQFQNASKEIVAHSIAASACCSFSRAALSKHKLGAWGEGEVEYCLCKRWHLMASNHCKVRMQQQLPATAPRAGAWVVVTGMKLSNFTLSKHEGQPTQELACNMKSQRKC